MILPHYIKHCYLGILLVACIATGYSLQSITNVSLQIIELEGKGIKFLTHIVFVYQRALIYEHFTPAF